MLELLYNIFGRGTTESFSASQSHKIHFTEYENGEVLIVTLRRKPNRFEHDMLGAFQSPGIFMAVRLSTLS